MDTRLLRMAKKDSRGIRRWIIPGWPHAITVIPAKYSRWEDSFDVSWPGIQYYTREIIKRGARFDWHHKIIKREIRSLLEAVMG